MPRPASWKLQAFYLPYSSLGFAACFCCFASFLTGILLYKGALNWLGFSCNMLKLVDDIEMYSLWDAHGYYGNFTEDNI